MYAQSHVRTDPSSAPLFVDARSCCVIERLERVAPSEASVLIVGETGTGKEVVAREIHARSGRVGPFVAVNCGALSEQLGEAALFGHEAGAYTGAVGARAGWFEAANGGTLFLDEIGDLPLALQVSLLRVLQERQVVRLGARKATPIGVRVIAATNIDMGKAVKDGKFRLDLYFRLSVVTLDLPPLRERAEDILPLAEHFIRLYGEKLQRNSPVLSRDAQRALLEYRWPGNVRELENVVHAALLTAGKTIERSDLRWTPWLAEVTGQGVDDSGAAALRAPIDQLLQSQSTHVLEEIESLVVRRALALCNGNQVHTAKMLGITRNVLRTYLKRFGLLSTTDPRVSIEESRPLRAPLSLVRPHSFGRSLQEEVA